MVTKTILYPNGMYEYVYDWEDTPRWLQRWFRFPPRRRYHDVGPDYGDPLGYWQYARAGEEKA